MDFLLNACKNILQNIDNLNDIQFMKENQNKKEHKL